LLGEALVRIDSLGRDADHLGTDLVEPLAFVAIGAELFGADRGEIAGVEGDHQLAAAVVGKAVGLAARSGKLELRRRISYVDLGHCQSLRRRGYPRSTDIFSITTGWVGFSSAPPSSPIASTTFRPLVTWPASAYSGGSVSPCGPLTT